MCRLATARIEELPSCPTSSQATLYLFSAATHQRPLNLSQQGSGLNREGGGGLILQKEQMGPGVAVPLSVSHGEFNPQRGESRFPQFLTQPSFSREQLW